MRVIICVLGLALSGCLAPPEYVQRPGQREAIQLVWSYIYGMFGELPPRIQWRCDHCPEFPDACNVIESNGRCVGGYFVVSSYLAVVGTDPDDYIWDSSFAHELLHAALYRRGLGADPRHERPEWFLVLPYAVGSLACSDL